jgi:HD superfamily phosphohydrolase
VADSAVLRDVIHGYIRLDKNDRLLLDSPIVQRLRHVRQNDVAHLVFPSMNTTRLEHSLGVLHVAGLLAETALTAAEPAVRTEYLDALNAFVPASISERPEPAELFVRSSRWYGLLHDVGHLPFSHLTEHCLAANHDAIYPDDDPFEKLHESAGAFVVKNDKGILAAFEAEPAAGYIVTALMSEKLAAHPTLQPLKDILDSDVDADRIDSTARDGLLAGGDLGRYDSGRLQLSTVLTGEDDAWRVRYTTRAIHAIESLLVERFKTYRWIHFHPKVVAYKNAFRLAFIDGLSMDLDHWHARNYRTENGFLDDAAVRELMAKANPAEGSAAAYARKALLFRTNDARSLWKRRDDYVSLSNTIAKSIGAPAQDSNAKEPCLNRLKKKADVLEVRLSEACQKQAMPARLALFSLKFTPFEVARWDEHIGDMQVLKHSDLRTKVLLTSESHIVLSLKEAAEREPALGVSVIGDAERKHDEKLRELFVKEAAKLWKEEFLTPRKPKRKVATPVIDARPTSPPTS